MSSLAAQKRTAQSVVDAYNAWDLEAVIAFRAPNCVQQVLPVSMGRPPQSNEEYRENFARFIPLFKNFTVKVRNAIHDPESHTSVLLATSTAETAIGPYSNEYALVLTFTEDGEKVVRFEEFVDSAYTLKHFAALAAAREKEA